MIKVHITKGFKTTSFGGGPLPLEGEFGEDSLAFWPKEVNFSIKGNYSENLSVQIRMHLFVILSIHCGDSNNDVLNTAC